MKILIPTDFSKLSKVAVRYAIVLGQKFKAETILLNVVYIPGPPKATLKTQYIEKTLKENAEVDCIQLINEIKKGKKGKLNISCQAIKGYPVEDVVKSFSIHNDIDLIIMGTKGATGLKKVLIGSNAAAVINSSKIPVITVPEYARFKPLKNIVYATDMKNLYAEIKNILPLAKLFNAHIHLLHVIPPTYKKKIDKEKVVHELIRKVKYSKVTFHISMNDDVPESIEEYISDSNAEMLVMFTHKLSLFEKLFGTSVTRRMAFHGHTPLFTIRN